MLKGTPVELIEIRLSDFGLSGKGIALLSGTLHDIEAAAVLAAEGTGDPLHGFSCRMIPGPHDDMSRVIGTTTSYDVAPLLELDGEEG